MQLFCNSEIVIATHEDNQEIDPLVYGEGIEKLIVPDDFVFERFGPEPAEGKEDYRPFARPEVAGDLLITTIKAECRRRIYDVASAEAQMNMATATAVISGKTSAQRSVGEAAVLSDVNDALIWVAAMRGEILVMVADPSIDYLDDASWPQCPANVVAVAGLF